MNKKMIYRSEGFTLIETVVSIALIASIIAKIFIPNSFIANLWLNSIIIAVFTLIIPFFNAWLYKCYSLD